MIGGKLGPLPLYFFAKSPDQKFEISILFNIVKKSNNYVFDEDSILHSPRRKGWKLWALPIVYT